MENQTKSGSILRKRGPKRTDNPPTKRIKRESKPRNKKSKTAILSGDTNHTIPKQPHIDKNIFKTTERIIIPFYLFMLFMSSALTLLLAFGLVPANQRHLGTALLIAFTSTTSFVGSYMVYAWGPTQTGVGQLSHQNEHFEKSIDALRATKKNFNKEMKRLRKRIDRIKRNGNELEKGFEAYEDLRKELQKICDEKMGGDQSDDNETGGTGDCKDVMHLLKEFNEQSQTLHGIMADNELAGLLNIFYEANCDDDFRLDAREYERFMDRCSKETRAKFEKYGGFDAMDANNSNLINEQEFESVVQKVLADTIRDSQNSKESSMKIQGEL